MSPLFSLHEWKVFDPVMDPPHPGLEARLDLFRNLFESYALSWDQMKKISGLEDHEIEMLVGEGYILGRPSFYSEKIHYLPTSKARRFLRENGVRVYVETPKEAPLKNELHDKVLTDLKIAFADMGHTVWQTERCLRQRGMKKVRPDAILELGRRKIAIELELTSKTRKDYEKRFVFYRDHPAIDAVFYFVATPTLRQKMLELTETNENIYVVLLRNFIQHKKSCLRGVL